MDISSQPLPVVVTGQFCWFPWGSADTFSPCPDHPWWIIHIKCNNGPTVGKYALIYRDGMSWDMYGITMCPSCFAPFSGRYVLLAVYYQLPADLFHDHHQFRSCIKVDLLPIRDPKTWMAGCRLNGVHVLLSLLIQRNINQPFQRFFPDFPKTESNL